MALSRWIPFKDLIFLQERMGRIFDEALQRYAGIGDPSSCTFFPPADVVETGDRILLKVEVPGVSIDDVEVEVEENTLILRGERKQRKLESEHYHRMESSYGTFQRVFKLSSVIDKSGVKAGIKDGVLEISVPKVKKSKIKKIKVQKD